MSTRLFIAIVAAAVILAGCGRPEREPLKVCEGKGSAVESLFAVRLRSANVVPVRATGTCRMQYYVEGKRKPQKEAIPVKLWMNPPSEVYLQGDVAFDARGLVLGANKDEFWLSIRPKKVSSYWWGSWSQNDYAHNLMLSPKIVLEAIGITATEGDGDDKGDWSLSNEGPFDILTRRSETGLISKRIYVCSCDYLVRKIEYFNDFGQMEVVAEIQWYKEVVDGFSAPTSIRVIKRTGTGKDDWASVTLKSIREWTKISEKQLKYLFTRPSSERFKYVYEVVHGKWVEQPE